MMARAQFTTVSGTVLDPNALPYAQGTIAPVLITTGVSPTLNGQPYTPPTQPVGLDNNGAFTMRLADTSVLQPSGLKWNFVVCSAVGTVPPALGFGSRCFSLAVPIAITGSSVSISTQLQAVALALTRLFGTGAGIGGTVSANFIPVASGPNTLANSGCTYASSVETCPGFALSGTSPMTFSTAYGNTPSLSSGVGFTSLAPDPTTGKWGQSIDAGAYDLFLTQATGVSSVFGRNGNVVAVGGDYSVGQVTGAAPLASPTFTGTVALPDGSTWNSTGLFPPTPTTNTFLNVDSSGAQNHSFSFLSPTNGVVALRGGSSGQSVISISGDTGPFGVPSATVESGDGTHFLQLLEFPFASLTDQVGFVFAHGYLSVTSELNGGNCIFCIDRTTGTTHTYAPFYISGATSGRTIFQVAAAAGTPNPLQWPTTTGTSGQALTTNGANPQQLSWTTISGGGSSSGVNFAMQTSDGAGNFTNVAPPTTNGTWQLTSPVTASAAVASAWTLPGVSVNAQAGNYSLAYTDRGAYIKEATTTTSTLTLPQVTGITASNFPFLTQNLNSGNETLTANAADSIDGGATGGSATVLPNFAAFVYQDSSSAPGNWWTVKVPTFSAFGASCAVLNWSTTSGFTCNSFQGNGAKVQLSTGSTTLNDCVKFDTNGNTVDAGSACGAGGSTTNAGSAGSTGVGIVLNGTSFAPLYGQYSSIISTEANADLAFATAITVSKLYIDLGTATGASQTVVATLRKNGANTAVTCTVGNAAQTCTDTTHSVTTVAGDLLDWQLVLNTLTLTSNVSIGSQVGSAVQTYSGNTTTAASVSGALTSGDSVKVDASGNLIDTGSAAVATNRSWIGPQAGAVAATAIAANNTKLWSYSVTATVSTVAKFTYGVQTADNSANLYDLGLYNTSGTLVWHTGATAGSTIASAAGPLKIGTLLATANVPAGEYYFAETGNAATFILDGVSNTAAEACGITPAGSTGVTSGGVLNSSVTIPTPSLSTCTTPNFGFSQ